MIANTIGDNQEISTYSYLEAKTNRRLNLFWTGFVIYTVAYAFSNTSFESSTIAHPIQILGLVIFIPSAISLIRYEFESRYLKYAFNIYCIWVIFIISRGFSLNTEFIKTMLFDAYDGIFLYFAPFILLFPRNIAAYKKMFSVIIILGIFYVVLDIIYLKALLDPDGSNLTSQAIMEYFSKTLSLPCGFLVLTYLYHPNKRKYSAALVIILTLLLSVIRARRALIFINLSIILFTFITYYSAKKNKIIAIVTSLILIVFISIGFFNVFNSNKNGLFALLNERGDEDTRTGVELCLYDDMTTKDWIIGKGINGEYYCPGIDSDLAFYRNGIESDYLNIILKGGIISLAILLLIAIPAVIKGIFFSKNILSKAAGIWILLWMIELYPAPVTKFTLNYLLVWICIGICYSKNLRGMTDNSLIKYFKYSN